MKTYTLKWGKHTLALGGRTAVMGIVNVTPDSFSDGGLYYNIDKAVEHGRQLAESGADIIDIGGESTRPFADSVSTEEELQRVVPVIAKLAAKIAIPISIDTVKAEVARQALDAGASIINDISALRHDKNMADLAAQYGVPLILMHIQGTPRTMQVAPQYDNLIAEIKTFLEDAIRHAEKKGVLRSAIIVDPGIGFGKTAQHNYSIIRHLDQFESLDVPILIGLSRKAFIRNTLKAAYDREFTPDSAWVETGTQAAVSASVLKGAHIVRVHDVANTRATLEIADTLKRFES
ncbi:dihydropteroate synthase [Desulfococcaceae bacterium HSG7]|nr:dihydropteroate synthase [Desulfococcaceae bacterium HSG7]